MIVAASLLPTLISSSRVRFRSTGLNVRLPSGVVGAVDSS
jgi:hypothetical protein